MQTQKRKALVVGGGIGGLTAALALRRGGWDVAVYEQAPELKEVGSGLMVSTNAMRLLFELGLKDIVSRGREVTHGEMAAWSGEVLAAHSLEALARRCGAPSVVFHRAALHSALAEAFGGEGVHLGARLQGFEDDGHTVVARFEDGREARGDLLVGADGLKSRVRAQLHGDAPPRYAGYPCWRGLTGTFSHPNLPVGILRETQGRGARFGVCYYTESRVYWWATVNGPAGQPVPGGDKAYLLEAFRTAHAPIPQLIAETEEADLLRTDLYDRPPLKGAWGRGRVTLLGDAAHPMLPNLGQGACSAIEDGYVLARTLEAASDVELGLRAYEERRKERTARLQSQSRLTGAMGQWENSVGVWMRERMFKSLPPSLLWGEAERIWGWQP